MAEINYSYKDSLHTISTYDEILKTYIKYKDYNLLISISHEQNYTVAVAYLI